MKTWGRAVVSAFWFATVMAAAQVGAACVTGVLRLDGEFPESDAWNAQLTLLSWFAISSVIAGAYAGGRAAGSATRLSAAITAGLGGAAGGSLALYPARSASLSSGDGLLMAGIALGFAAIAGCILAFGLLSARALGWNTAVVAAGVWALLAVGVASHAPLIRLGQLDTPDLSRSFVHSLSLWGLPALVALVSAATAITARLRGHHRLAIAFSGLAGPATIALAYAIAGPGSTDVQKIPWTSALAALAAGLAASILVALPPRRTRTEAVTADDRRPALTPLAATPTLTELPRRSGFADLDDRFSATR